MATSEGGKGEGEERRERGLEKRMVGYMDRMYVHKNNCDTNLYSCRFMRTHRKNFFEIILIFVVIIIQKWSFERVFF